MYQYHTQSHREEPVAALKSYSQHPTGVTREKRERPDYDTDDEFEGRPKKAKILNYDPEAVNNSNPMFLSFQFRKNKLAEGTNNCLNYKFLRDSMSDAQYYSLKQKALQEKYTKHYENENEEQREFPIKRQLKQNRIPKTSPHIPYPIHLQNPTLQYQLQREREQIEIQQRFQHQRQLQYPQQHQLHSFPQQSPQCWSSQHRSVPMRAPVGHRLPQAVRHVSPSPDQRMFRGEDHHKSLALTSRRSSTPLSPYPEDTSLPPQLSTEDGIHREPYQYPGHRVSPDRNILSDSRPTYSPRRVHHQYSPLESPIYSYLPLRQSSSTIRLNPSIESALMSSSHLPSLKQLLDDIESQDLQQGSSETTPYA